MDGLFCKSIVKKPEVLCSRQVGWRRLVMFLHECPKKGVDFRVYVSMLYESNYVCFLILS